jgi:hypothetical protein
VAENKSAVKFLVEEVFNDLAIPLIVTGLNPSPSVIHQLEAHPHITLIPSPTNEELFELINNAHINISYTFQATGLKLKLLNTLYNGRFCLVNDKMLSGSAVDELCILANDAKAMKQQVKRIFKRSFSKKEINRREKKLDLLYHNGQNVDRLIDLIG